MNYAIEWKIKALKQARKLHPQERQRIINKVDALADWPDCPGVKALTSHPCQYRLRVGDYRVLFNVETSLTIIAIEEVKKRDERTY